VIEISLLDQSDTFAGVELLDLLLPINDAPFISDSESPPRNRLGRRWVTTPIFRDLENDCSCKSNLIHALKPFDYLYNI